jgi:hypothetical protein
VLDRVLTNLGVDGVLGGVMTRCFSMKRCEAATSSLASRLLLGAASAFGIVGRSESPTGSWEQSINLQDKRNMNLESTACDTRHRLAG